MEVLAFFFYGTDVFLGVAQGEVDGDDVLGCPRFHHSNTRECYVCVFLFMFIVYICDGAQVCHCPSVPLPKCACGRSDIFL